MPISRDVETFPHSVSLPGQMPRYFFPGSDHQDDESIVLTDDARANKTARETFGQMIADGDAKANADLHVMDEMGRSAVSFLNFSVGHR